MNGEGNGITLKLFGFVPSYLLILKENYFGSTLSFVTVDEYRDRISDPSRADEQKKYQELARGDQNFFDVRLGLTLSDCMVLLPENLYSCERFSSLRTRELYLDLRNNDLYMDITTNCSPISWTYNDDDERSPGVRPPALPQPGRTLILVEDLFLHAHRMFGPQPKNLVYAVDYQIRVTSIQGEMQPSFVPHVVAFAKAFALHFADEENIIVTRPLFADFTSAHMLLSSILTILSQNYTPPELTSFCPQFWFVFSYRILRNFLMPAMGVGMKSVAGNAGFKSTP
ncbi:hypothetical protein M427DRAFT_194435 [Gonapodya prolifera JEL478]|uniref:Uncharacterized protein n=1 Tax=Gonapodya prolifera (strain JEL478) TaxID=1344416 RepID=A0A139AP91_GONPJ|nr:hypothetical protein M427DRAFT_194435 [Gonapodya prolifera JEL478]|eukprot:KXS18556.1 hypothetical protein M427DRAFT_194435 [Gonapodya prolifera JEL478]